MVPTQWNENPEIQEYMRTQGLKDPHAPQAHFNIRLQKIVVGKGTSAKEAHGGTLLAVVKPVQKLLDSATKK